MYEPKNQHCSDVGREKFMKSFSRRLAIILALLMVGSIASCANNASDEGKKDDLEKWRPIQKKLDVRSDSLHVSKVENLSDSFIFGMDPRIYEFIRYFNK